MPYLEENVDGVFQLTVYTYPTSGGPPGEGVPTGGTTGQVLAKASNTNYDTEWVEQTGGGGGAVDAELVDLSAETPGAIPYDASAITKAGVTLMLPPGSYAVITDLPSSATRDSFRVAAVRASGTGAIGLTFDAGAPVQAADQQQILADPGWCVMDLAPIGTGGTWFVSSMSPSPLPPPGTASTGDYVVVNGNSLAYVAPPSGTTLSDATPQALGTAAAGVSTDASRADHVHAMPSAADVGAVPTSRAITAGTGLSGGGDLTANRTLTVAYGTTSGTALEGNTTIPWPRRILITPANYPDAVSGIAIFTQVNGLMGGFTESSTTNNQSWTWDDLPLDAGTWAIDVWHQKFNNGGIITVTLGGTGVGTVDTYNSTTTSNNRTSLTGITISSPNARVSLVLTNPTKNASSGNYGMRVNAIQLRRTGA